MSHTQPHTPEPRAKMSMAHKGKPAPWKHRETQLVDGVPLYRCGTCAEFLPRDCFYTDRRTLLGLKSQCKACHTATTIASRDADNARRLTRESAARCREADPERFRERERAASAKRPRTEKTRARVLLNTAVRSGIVERPLACDACQVEGPVQGHHEDYSQPLQVRWLCPLCHAREHRKP